MTVIRSSRTLSLSSQSSHGFYEFILWPMEELWAWEWSCTDVLQVSRLCSHSVYTQHSYFPCFLSCTDVLQVSRLCSHSVYTQHSYFPCFLSCTDVLQVSRLCSHSVYTQHSYFPCFLSCTVSCRSVDFVLIQYILNTFIFPVSWAVRMSCRS